LPLAFTSTKYHPLLLTGYGKKLIPAKAWDVKAVNSAGSASSAGKLSLISVRQLHSA
jgi:hypothetical protein